MPQVVARAAAREVFSTEVRLALATNATDRRLLAVMAPLVLLTASLLASFVPAVRATRVDPTVALRSE